MLKQTRAFYLILTVFLASSLMFTSCSEDDSNPIADNNPNNNLSCTIDGDSWEAYGVFSRDVDEGENAIVLVAVTPDMDIFSMILVSPKLGDNQVTSDSGNFGTIRIGNTRYLTETGVITLTTLTETRVTGTFEFTAKAIDINNPSEVTASNVTNGKFDLEVEPD